MAKILVADSDRAFHGRALEIIKTLENHQVVCVSDGLKALAQIYSGHFDLVILDSDLPYLDGLCLLEAARTRHPQASVLLITESDDFELAREALHLGAFEILRRPFENRELKTAIVAGLDESRQMRSLGFAYKDQRRDDPALIKGGIMTAIGDSIFSGMAFFLAFLFAPYIGGGSSYQPLSGIFEPFMLGLGLASCYAFAFILTRSHRTDLVGSRAGQILQLMKNLSLAYVAQIAILFFVRDTNFQPGREVIILGYVMGIAALIVNRFVILPAIGAAGSREGKRRIIIKGLDQPEFIVSKKSSGETGLSIARADITEYKPGPHPRLVSSAADYQDLEFERHVDEVYISENVFSPSHVARLVEGFRGQELKIVIASDKPESGRKPRGQAVST